MNFDNGGNNNSRNLLLAVLLSVGIMFVSDYFLGQSNTSQSTEQIVSKQEVTEDDTSESEEKESTSSEKIIGIKEALESGKRVPIGNSRISGSIDLNGGILDHIYLKEYKETLDENSDNVVLLNPKNTENESYMSIIYTDKTNNEEIDDKAVWVQEDDNVDGVALLRTQTKNGLIIDRMVSMDDRYLIRITDKILNVSDKDVKLAGGASLLRRNPPSNNYAVVHEGLVYLSGGKVEEVKYKNIEKKTKLNKCQWIGYSDIYWLCSIIPQNTGAYVTYGDSLNGGYSVSEHEPSVILKKDSEMKREYVVYVGPKDVSVLKAYQEELGLDKFEMNIDFGWFFFFTKPLLYVLDFLQHLLSNMGLVILLLTIAFKLLTHPLTKKSYISAAKMKELQPKIALLQKSYTYDKVKLNQELMALYKKEKVSPLSGCLPMLLQAPIFFCLYKVFFISIEMRHAPLFGWINDLSAPDPCFIFNLFGAIDWTPPKLLQIGVWPLIMGITMFLQQKITMSKNKGTEQTPEAKIQQNMMMFLPIIFTYVCSSFPVGVVVYWTLSNIISFLQQLYVNRTLGTKKK